MRTRVKICGLTTLDTAQACVAAGADAIGLVFYPPSPRALTPKQAQALVAAIPPYVQAVGLFVDAQPDEVATTVAQVGLDVVQLHGSETPAQCAAIGRLTQRRWYKALAVRPGVDVLGQVQAYAAAGASAVLLDAWHPQLHGGTGQAFDWRLWPRQAGVPLILAGGLTPDNVAAAIGLTRPHAVDVSGGVERQKGVKCPTRIHDFLTGVQAADGQHN